MQFILEILVGITILLVTIAIIALIAWLIWKRESRSNLNQTLRRHFRPTALDQLVVTERQFPVQIRADLQSAIDDYLETAEVCFFTGVQQEYGIGGVDFNSLLDESLISVVGTRSGPPQYEQIDVGEDEPVRTLRSGLWLLNCDGIRLAILYAPLSEFGGCGMNQSLRVQIASPQGSQPVALAEQFLKRLESAVEQARCYRGKVLSLDQDEEYTGKGVGVQVHRLGNVSREEVILPERTLELLERNIIKFIGQRERLAECGMTIKKGVLFYGPPGTGKTHTIRYLEHALAGHTTLLISAEQVGLLGQYMTLARLLQPSIVVIEDVDLIARDRAHMHDPTAELLLNKLLNEMDGLREDSAILFILTTNRPEQLEAALASRPGRIDQAIEFPLPDEQGREKLVHLYARGLQLRDDVVATIISRTDKVSASFIKELMRRSAQYCLERDNSNELAMSDVERALDEIFYAGGSLNLKLLGGNERIDGFDAS